MGLEHNIPVGWVETTLGESINLIGGGTPKTTIEEYWDGDIPWLSVVDFNDDNRWVSKTEKTITKLGLDKSSTKLLNKGDVIISARGTVGALAQLKYPMTFNQSCFGIRQKENITSENFMFYLIKCSIQKINRNVHGAVFDTITKQTFDFINIVLPPLPEQKAIAKILTVFDNKIELLQAQNKTLETVAQTIFKEWFGKYQIGDELPEGWRVGKLGEIVTPIKGKNITKKQVIKGPYPVIAGGLKPSVFHNVCNTKSPVITVSASGANAGFVALHHHPVWSSDSTYIDVSFTDYFYFIYIFLKSNQSLIYDKQEGSAIPHVYPRHLENLNLIIPTRSEMGKYEELSVNIFHKLSNNESTIDTLSKTRDTLLPKLMSGQVRVNNIKNA